MNRIKKIIICSLPFMFCGTILCSCSSKDSGSDVPLVHKVIFNTNYIRGTDTIVTVKDGEKVEPISDPKADGFEFNGWYLNTECTQPYKFDSLVKTDIKLYAFWKSTNIDKILDVIGAKDNLIYSLPYNDAVVNGQVFYDGKMKSIEHLNCKIGDDCTDYNFQEVKIKVDENNFVKIPVALTSSAFVDFINETTGASDLGSFKANYYFKRTEKTGNPIVGFSLYYTVSNKICKYSVYYNENCYVKSFINKIENIENNISISSYSKKDFIHTVTWLNSLDSSLIQINQVGKNTPLSSVSFIPSSPFFSFNAWYANPSCLDEDIVDLEHTLVNRDMYLYAGWKITSPYGVSSLVENLNKYNVVKNVFNKANYNGYVKNGDSVENFSGKGNISEYSDDIGSLISISGSSLLSNLPIAFSAKSCFDFITFSQISEKNSYELIAKISCHVNKFIFLKIESKCYNSAKEEIGHINISFGDEGYVSSLHYFISGIEYNFQYSNFVYEEE